MFSTPTLTQLLQDLAATQSSASTQSPAAIQSTTAIQSLAAGHSKAFSREQREAILSSYQLDKIYHMTHIKNLSSILSRGILAHGNRYQSADISNQDVNQRRAKREPVYGRRLHEYTPFYFTAKNMMMFFVQNEFPDEVVVLEIDAQALVDAKQALVTDINAAKGAAQFYPWERGLAAVNFDLIRSSQKYRQDSAFQAEALIFGTVAPSYISSIAVNSEEQLEEVKAIAPKSLKVYEDLRGQHFFSLNAGPRPFSRRFSSRRRR